MRIDGLKWILSISFALGFVFEVSRRYVAQHNQERARLALESSDMNPYSESRSQIAHSKRQGLLFTQTQPDQIQANSKRPTQGQFDSNAPKTEGKESKAENEKPKKPKCKVNPDDENGQGLKAVQLAQNDLKDDQGNPVPTPEEDCDPEETEKKIGETSDELPFEVSKKEAKDEDLEENSRSNSGDTATAPLMPSAGGQAMTPEYAMLQAWKSRLLLSPDFSATVDLIQQFQNNQISANLFYQLVDLMIASPQAQIQDYGVLAAGRTPSLKSFLVLSGVISGGTYSQNVKTRAESEMRFYEQPQFLNVLEAVLKQSSDTQSIILAIQHIDASAQKYLTGSAPPPTNGGQNQGETPAPSSAKSSLQNTYKRLVASLEQLLTELPSSQAGQVQQSIAKIKQLLQLPS